MAAAPAQIAAAVRPFIYIMLQEVSENTNTEGNLGRAKKVKIVGNIGPSFWKPHLHFCLFSNPCQSKRLKSDIYLCFPSSLENNICRVAVFCTSDKIF